MASCGDYARAPRSRRWVGAAAAIALCAAIIAAFTTAAQASNVGNHQPDQSSGSWRTARATRYDGPDDWWSIHEGSCGYGYLDQNAATGWDVAAMSDACEDFSSSCGRCLEVKCDPMAFADGYGEYINRTGACRDPEASVIVQVTDSCPCNYPNNAYSNKRWCCGDMYHLDLSIWAFEKLADKKWGVIGLQVRRVPCWQKPNKAGYTPWDGSPHVSRINRPQEWHDRRPWY